MDRELVHSLLYLSPTLEKSHPDHRSELERELSLFERLIPSLTQVLSPLFKKSSPAHTVEAAQPIATATATRTFEPTINAPVREPTIVGTQGHAAQNPHKTSAYAGGSIPFKRSFLNRSRIIKGS
ncbi:MAG: hypothetical protein KA715_05960 [Xanthomonadaceae bacterium]|nr:hypothetical protein [Xanthomonadaceae bacterium]